MAGEVGTLECLAQQVGLALQPLEAQLAPTNIIPFFAQLGLQFPPQLASQSAFMGAVEDASSAAGALTGLLTQLATDIDNQDSTAIVSDGVQLIGQIGKIASALSTIGTQLENISSSLPGLTAAEVEAFGTNLAETCLNYALISYFEINYPGVVGVANLIGIVGYTHNPGTPNDPTHPPYVTRKLQLSNIGQLLSTPSDLFKTLFDWGSPAFDGSKFLPTISESLRLIGLSPQLDSSGSPSQLFTSLVSLKVNPGSNPPGLLATVNSPIESPVNLSLPLNATWSINFQISGSYAAGISATLTPPMQFTLQPPSGVLSGQLLTSLVATVAGNPIVIFGETGGSVLQADSMSFGGGVNLTWDPDTSLATADPSVQFGVTGGKLVIDMRSADGFLAEVTGGTPIQASFNFNAIWAPDTGLHISGGSQLELTLPLAIDLGPINLSEAYLDIGISGDDLAVALAVAFGATLGPIDVSVDHIGLQGLISFPAQGGNLGPANLTVGFKPPAGLGIAIDAGVVSGGGYISFDPAKGQYAGVLDVTLADIVAVKVIGVLDTKLPDGSSGYSFLLMITFDLPPIQLSFGFTLNGVGGLGGVNRTMVQDALRAGLRAHALDNVLFPPDPIANAPQIISDIESFYPPQQGRYLFGPMVEIGWGEANLLTLSVGIILEVPDPVRLAILGEVKVAIPTPDLALIEMNIDVLGTIDFGLGKIAIDGTMYDSHVLAFQLGGDMAFRLTWAGAPEFLVSFGGFNPTFKPPPDVPQLNRLSISLGSGDNPRLSAQSYFAVTSNTLQFGANVELYASAAGFSVHGWVGFDALFQFSPFAFEIDFSAGFDVSFEGASFAGIQLDASLSGITPWHLHGDASFHILFFSVSASIDLTWGDTKQTELPAQPVLPPLVAALGDPRNWSVTLPSSTDQLVTLRMIPADQTSIVVHPLGSLSVRETIVPLDIPITKFNGVMPADGGEFRIAAVTLNGDPASATAHQEYFAIAQFTDMSDADKLSAPSYELFDAGVTVGASPVSAGDDAARSVEYQERYIDDFNALSRFGQIYTMPVSVHAVLALSGQAARVPSATTGLRRYATPGMTSPIKVANMSYAVAGTSDLAQRTDILAGATTRYEAVSALKAYVGANPTARGTVQVVTAYELAA
jgi:hypothetical protein